MRHAQLVNKTKSRGLSLALSPIHSLLIAILLFLLPSKAVSRAVPQNLQTFTDISETLKYRRDNTIKMTTPIDCSSWEKSTTIYEDNTSIEDSVQATITPANTRACRTRKIARDVSPSDSETTSPVQERRDSVGLILSTPEKIGIGIGVPLAIICLAFIGFSCKKRNLLRNIGLGNRDGSNVGGEGGFSELDAGRADGWNSGGYDSASRPLSQNIGLSTGSTEVETWHPLSRKLPTHPSASVPEKRYSIGITAGAGTILIPDNPISHTHQKVRREKRRPVDLQPLTLSAPLRRPFTAGSQASPGLLSHSGMNSPQVRPGHQSTVSSKSSSTLGLTAFFSPGQGHERHGSTSTRISHKSRKGSTATTMTNNYEMEMATLSSASEPQFPTTPRDYDVSLSGGLYTGRLYRNSGYSCFDSEREEIAPIKSQAYMPQSQTSNSTPPTLPSLPLSTRSRHRHSRTSSSGINAVNIVNSIPSIFSTPKVRLGTSPLGARTKGKAVRKEDERVINHDTTYFDDCDEDEYEDIDSLHSSLPQINPDKRHSRRHSSSVKRVSKGQSEEVDGEEVWTDTDEEQDSDFIITGGLGSRFGKKKLDFPA